MAAFFGDTSALVKRYVSETGSAWLTATIHPNLGQRIYIAQITIVEIVSAITERKSVKRGFNNTICKIMLCKFHLIQN